MAQKEGGGLVNSDLLFFIFWNNGSHDEDKIVCECVFPKIKDKMEDAPVNK